MKTILHIGMPKTGTTALQECLRASRSRLAGHGVLYPENPAGCGFNNHRILMFGFTPFRKLPRHILRQSQYTRENYADKYREFLTNIYAQVEAARPTHTVLSSESLFNRLRPRARRSLVGALEPLGGDVAVAIYLRKPSEFYLSNLQQILKQSHDLGWLRVRATFNPVRSYAKAFGREAIRLRTYARSMLTNGDIVEDFLASQLADLPIDVATLDRGTNANETVSAESVDLMRRYRMAFHPDANNVSMADSTRLLRELRRIEAGTAAQKPRLLPEVAEFIDYSRGDPLLLRDTYGIVFPGLDYRRLERRWLPRLPRLTRRPASLSELMHIDAAVQREILAGLLGTRWARAEPARGPWIDGLLRDLRG